MSDEEKWRECVIADFKMLSHRIKWIEFTTVALVVIQALDMVLTGYRSLR